MKASGPAVAEDGYGLEVTIGPAPCSECHSPLWFVGGKWQERHYRRTGSDGFAIVPSKEGRTKLPLVRMVRTYQPHVCPARVENNPLHPPAPKGKQGRGGNWRNMVGKSRYRTAPRRKPELI